MKIEHSGKISGRARLAVIDGASGKVVRQLPWQKNLILDSGLNNFFWYTGGIGAKGFYSVTRAFAGTGSTANSVILNGTFSQSGDTITRQSGTGTFASGAAPAGDVGKRVRFEDGSRGKITEWVSATSVKVDVSQTVAAQALAVYRTDLTALAALADTSNTLATSDGMTLQFRDPSSQTTVEMKTWIFPLRESPISYTEIGFGNSSDQYFSRILLESPVAVDVGQQLRVSYECTLADDFGITSTPGELSISGWPRPYNITGIAASATYFDVTLSEAHHFVTGGKINISGALPTKAAITAISSDASTFTVTAPGHGFSAAQQIVIAGCLSKTAYNGTWTVDSVNGNDFTVSSDINPGAESTGTCRRETPGTWYDGEWTIASCPTASSLRITSAIQAIPAGADGTAFNNLKVHVIHPRHGFRAGHDFGGSAYYDRYLFEGRDIYGWLNREGYEWAFTGFPQYTPTPSGGTGHISASSIANTPHGGGDGIQNTLTFSIDAANFGDLRQLILCPGSSNGAVALVVNFDERQRKDSTHQLIITLERKIHAELAWPA